MPLFKRVVEATTQDILRQRAELTSAARASIENLDRATAAARALENQRVLAEITDPEYGAQKGAIDADLIDARSREKRSNAALENHVKEFGDDNALAERQRADEIEQDRQEKTTLRDAYRAKMAELLKLGDAMRTVSGDLDGLWQAARQRFPGQSILPDSPLPPGMFIAAPGEGPSKVFWNSVLLHVCRAFPELVQDPTVRDAAEKVRSNGFGGHVLHFLSW